MNNIIKERTREQLAKFLPDAIAQALTNYQRFSEQDIEDEKNGKTGKLDSKKFSEHQKACQAAIAHIELLLKLATIFDLPDAGVGNPNDQILLSVMMQEAREELTGYEDSGEKKEEPG